MGANTNTHWILGLKHWQLFALMVAPRILEYLFLSFGSPNQDYYWIELMYYLYMLTLICGWIYFTTVNLYPLLPSSLSMNLKRFKIDMAFCFFPPFVLLAITLFREFRGNGGSGFFELAVLIGVILLYPIICLFKSMYFMIKTLKSVELQRPVTKNDLGLIDLTILYPPIGAWLLQPRINYVQQMTGMKQQLQPEKV